MTGGDANLPSCGFCSTSYREVGPLVQGQTGFVCGHCLLRLTAYIARKGYKPNSQPAIPSDSQSDTEPNTEPDFSPTDNAYASPSDKLSCSFCGISDDRKLLKSRLSDCFICLPCVHYSSAILDEELAKGRPGK
jgi:hypothetical protein